MKSACLLPVSLLAAAALFSQSGLVPRDRQPSAVPTSPRASQEIHLSLTSVAGAAAHRVMRPHAPGLDFAAAVAYNSGGGTAQSAAIADVNGDGRPDLLVANVCISTHNCSNGTIGVLLGNGDGTFQAAVTYGSGGYEARSVAVADVNGDGKVDLVVANGCTNGSSCNSGSVGVLLGNGDGTFQTAMTYDSGGQNSFSVAAGDVNGDGKPDLLVVNLCTSSSNCDNGSVGVLLGNGDGTFEASVTYGSGGYEAFSIAVGDVNRDGKNDVLIVNQCSSRNNCTNGSVGGTVGVLLGNGDGTFQTTVTYGSGGSGALSVALADVNGDGKPDLLVGNGCNDSTCDFGTVGVLLGNGDGTFQAAVPYISGGQSALSVAVADVNGDGNPDVLLANYCGDSSCSSSGSVGVLLGNGDGTFQTAMAYGSGGYGAFSVAVADLNGDGKLDLFVADECASGDLNCANGTSGTVGVLINISTYPTTTALVSSANPSAFGQTVTFTVAVTQLFGKGTPSGSVTFFDGTTSIGTSTLNSSAIATLSTSTLAVGTHSITATYNGDANFAVSTSAVLSQVVQGAIVVLSPTSINFGNQTVGVMSAPQSVMLTNIGNAALTISSISLTGTHAASITVANNCGASIAAGGNCTVTLTATATSVGTWNASLNFADNAPNSPQTVALTGVGVLPAVTLAPASLTFPTQVVFTNSKVQTVTLTNTGLGILEISKVGVAGSFIQTNNCGSSVAAGASCTLNVTFRPTTKGPLTGSVSITDNAPGSPQKVALSGTGTYIQLAPASLNFGNQPVGTKSLPKKITLSNKGGTSVSITAISITGVNAADFTETNTCGASVASGASCFITVTFTPLAKGARSAAVSVTDNGGGSPQKVALAGAGT